MKNVELFWKRSMLTRHYFTHKSRWNLEKNRVFFIFFFKEKSKLRIYWNRGQWPQHKTHYKNAPFSCVFWLIRCQERGCHKAYYLVGRIVMDYLICLLLLGTTRKRCVFLGCVGLLLETFALFALDRKYINICLSGKI